MSEINWIPLESNPEVLNRYAHGLGMPAEWNFMDVFSLEDDVLAILPRPVAGMLFIYPITDKSEASKIGTQLTSASDVYFMKQTVRNACGTVALLHTIANNRQKLQLEANSTLEKFFNKSADSTCSPEDRAKLMETDEGLNTAHEAAANEGQTEAPSRESRPNLHFVAFINHNGQLLELDGRREGPVSHGATGDESFLRDCAGVIRQFMRREDGEVNFSIVALAKGEPLF